MKRIRPVAPRGLFARLLFRSVRRRLGRDLASLGILAWHPRLLRAVGGVEYRLDRARELPRDLRALVELRVASRIGCSFCLDIGTFLGLGDGLDAEKVTQLADYESSPLFSETERLCLRYADGITATPPFVDDGVFRELAGCFDEPQLVELTFAITWDNQRARFNSAMGLDREGFVPAESCPAPVAHAG